MSSIPRAKTITLPTGEHELADHAVLTGRSSESLVAGARVLFVEVEIHEAGRFNFFGDLCDGDGEPIGFVQRELDLAPGRVEVGLPITLDRADAAYEVSGLRVIRRRWS